MNNKLKNTLISAIRRVFLWSPLRRKVILNARVGKLVKCNHCHGLFLNKHITVDHIVPTYGVELISGNPKEGTAYYNWGKYMASMFCPIEGLQCLCGPCHTVKTAKDMGYKLL